MAWENSDRRSRLPNNWKQLREQILKRSGNRCEAIQRDGERCPETTRLEVDHIVRGDNHHPSNLQVLCNWHHARKTSRENQAAKKPRAPRHIHPGEQHPGLR